MEPIGSTDGEHVIDAVSVDNLPFGVAGGVRRIEGEQTPARADIVEQRSHGRALAPRG